ncbi:MAG: hypothetical protein GX334_08950, partial [Firmicutes bacterium]|nr:hypothetical protein [Bacillota bacterium]
RRYPADEEVVPLPAGPSLEEILAQQAAEEEFLEDISPEKTLQGRARKAFETNMNVAVAVLRSWLTEK